MLSRLDVRDPYHNPTNMMHHHQPQSAMNATTHSTPSDSLTQAVTRLLSRASSLPCSAAFGAFQKLVPDPDKFRLSLEVLLPVLSGAHAELTDRILSAYLLFALYAPHPFSLNPFKSALTEAFIHERDEAREASSRGQVHSNEQLVWVIWKILRGEGNDIGPFTPINLSASPLPPKLRPLFLTLEGEPSPPHSAASSPSNSNGAPGTTFPPATAASTAGLSSLQPISTSFGRAFGPSPPKSATPSHVTSSQFNAAPSPPVSMLERLRQRASSVDTGHGSNGYSLPMERKTSFDPNSPGSPRSPVGFGAFNFAGLGSGGWNGGQMGAGIMDQYRNGSVASTSQMQQGFPQVPSFIQASTSRTLSIQVSRSIVKMLPSLPPSMLKAQVTPDKVGDLVTFNGGAGGGVAIGIMERIIVGDLNEQGDGREEYLKQLRLLPPSLPAFDLVGALAKSEEPIAGSSPGGVTVGYVIRNEVLGGFIGHCIACIEKDEQDERDGLISDDRVGRAVGLLCMFYSSLLRSPSSEDEDAIRTEMTHFALQFSRFEAANALYRHLMVYHTPSNLIPMAEDDGEGDAGRGG